MSMRNPARSARANDLGLYITRSHAKKKHVALANLLLFQLWTFSWSNPTVDVWEELQDLEVETEDGKVTGPELKAALREFLLERQQERCCYCRRWLVNTAYAKPIEHILPRADFPNFSLHFWNLSVACVVCNLAKSATVWAAIPKGRRLYPTPEAFAGAFHPRFHEYDAHVSFVRLETNARSVVMFKGRTAEGRKLCRDLLHKVAGREMLYSNSPELAKAMLTLQGEGSLIASPMKASVDDFLRLLDARASDIAGLK